MTRDEILAMKPGRELDSLVAEKVMGYTTYGQFRDKDGVRVMIDRYSTDIAAAWEVAEKMTSLFWEMNLDTGSKSNTTKVEFYRTFDQTFHVVVANTAPEAICKAALLALEGGEGE